MMRIFLADLGHNKVTISSDVYPLGVANLAAYAQANLKTQEEIEIKIFREPQDLKAALDSVPPDVLGLSSYSWNHQLSCHFAQYAKARQPETITIFGGPNFPLTVDEQETYLRSLPEMDVAVRGPTYEGERAFLNLIQRYLDVGKSLDGLQEEPVPGNLWIDRHTEEFVHGGEVNRIRDLDEIPSPYLTGLMDPFYKTGYFPLLQISRGCPFTCAFCNSSVQSNSRIHSHSLLNVQADLLYIAERVRPEVPLCFADDNFGMYELDEEVADYIAYLQERYNWPQYIRTTTGKNKHERIIRVMRKTRGVLPMTSAVQSLNPEVLKNINRSNIKLEAYSEIQKELHSQGMQSYGELILCLPGETKASFMKAVRDLLDTGAKRISAHQLMLLHGAPLSTLSSRELWQFNTRFRVVARDIGNYTGEPVVEVEEIVVETPTFSFDDYLEARIFHLLLTIFYYEGNFEEAFAFARQEGINAFDLIVQMQSRLEQAPEGFKTLISDFLRESQEELFDSKDACLEWAKGNYDGVVDGTLGGNLLSKYSMIGRFYVTQDSLDFLEDAILKSLDSSLSEVKRTQLQAVMEYLQVVLLHTPFVEEMSKTLAWSTLYNIEDWCREGFTRTLEEYHFPQMTTFTTTVDPDSKAKVATRVATFGEHPAGLGKFTRTLFAQDLRRKVVTVESMASMDIGG
jgi:radical SAM superfamily enzyme YgiQ (UPF0313 family)